MYNIIYETNHQSRFDAGYRKLGAGALGWPRGMVWGGRWEGGSGWGTRVHPWRMHVDVWQNQYKIVKYKKKKKKLNAFLKGIIDMWKLIKIIMQLKVRIWYKMFSLKDHCCCLVVSLVWLFCNPMDCRPPGSSVWIGLPFLSLEDLPNPGIRPVSPALASELFTPEPPGKPVLRIKQL